MRVGRTIPPAASPIYFRDIINGFKGLVRGQREIERFRSELKQHFDSKHCFLVSSGRAALTIILKALHELRPERDRVLIPAYVCYSVPSAITRSGLSVELADVDDKTLDYKIDELKKVVDSYSLPEVRNNFDRPTRSKQKLPDDNEQRTVSRSQTRHSIFSGSLLAIIGAHMFGLCSDIRQIKRLANDQAVTVVEDAAQVMGTKMDQIKLGTLGDVSFFSLGRGKALSAVEGGIIITNRKEIADAIHAQLKHLRKYSLPELAKLILGSSLLAIFQHPAFFWFPKCLPFLKVGATLYDPNFKIRKFSSFQAGLSKNWEVKLAKFQNIRRKITEYWASIIKSESMHHYYSSNGHITDMLRFPIKIVNRNLWKKLLSKSSKNGYGLMFTYPDSVNQIAELKSSFSGQTYPNAERLPHQLITLPVHPYVSPTDIRKISKLLREIDHL